MSKQLIIFGAGKISEAVSYYFNREKDYEIIAYVVDDAFALESTFLNKPLVKLSEVESLYSPDTCSVFVAIGYQGMNKVRTERFNFFKEKGYTFASYVSPYVKGDFTLGQNSIVMDNAVMQPCVSLGDNVFVWGGAMIGHHVVIQHNCWLTGGCQIGGAVTVGTGTFVGLGAVVGNEVIIGDECMLGACTFTTRSLGEKTVLIAPPTAPHRLNSAQFTRLSTCFRV